jgi:cytoskeletal protein CcmA (bactofilin family)
MNTAHYPSESDASSIFQENVRIKGDLELSQPLFFDGKLTGGIVSTSYVTLGENGFVEGTMKAENATIRGRVKGNVSCAGACVLEASAVIEGDIKAARLSMKEGATFIGQVLVDCRPSKAAPRTPSNGTHAENQVGWASASESNLMTTTSDS